MGKLETLSMVTPKPKLSSAFTPPFLPSRLEFLSGRAGFTLLQLLITAIIVAILITLAVPVYNRAIERGRMAEAYAQFGLIKQAELSYYVEHYDYTTQWSYLDLQNPDTNPNRCFDYYLYDPAMNPQHYIAEAKRRLDYMNAFKFNYRLYMNSDWVISQSGF
jgi:Tfp pilus assembly protein PilE